MGFAHGGRTNCAAREAVQYLILQTFGLQPTAFCRGRLKTMFLIGDSYYTRLSSSGQGKEGYKYG